jgi:hypothetical protein
LVNSYGSIVVSARLGELGECLVRNGKNGQSQADEQQPFVHGSNFSRARSGNRREANRRSWKPGLMKESFPKGKYVDVARLCRVATPDEDRFSLRGATRE